MRYVLCMYCICILYVFQLEEFVTGLIGYKLANANHVLNLLKFMPIDYNLVKRVITSFNNLHYDKDTGIMHSLPASRVHELRGRQQLVIIKECEAIWLTTLAASIADSDSVLEVLLNDYIEISEIRKKGQKSLKIFMNISQYQRKMFETNDHHIDLYQSSLG